VDHHPRARSPLARLTARRTAPAIAATAIGLIILIAGCVVAKQGGSGRATPDAVATSTGTAACAPWPCDFTDRFAAAGAFIAGKPGFLGIVVRDRQTNAVWTAGRHDHLVWTASTIKLAMAIGLLERDRAGDISLDAKARKQIDDMLNFSSDDAATELWNRYGKSEMVARFRQVYGMAGLTFVPGFRQFWGFMKCSADDLNHLMGYILDEADPADRGYLVGAMRGVAPVQQWGVWGAGPAWHPGTKDGWSVETDDGAKHWVTNTVGFAGPDERYTVSVMYQLPPGIGSVAGGQTISDLVATVFGAPVPAPVTVPSSE
jgi:hypothetical protein